MLAVAEAAVDEIDQWIHLIDKAMLMTAKTDLYA